eukprot:TRINITY_DN8005_c0_g1_i1.p1 TRINITY_DN8005_c0_g1~~TRINITY_DN8005_c0_g1_i1.p1  ORF type:complete len:289 (+),score=50.21 TRINITY_DN8005_c0_g1_i1:617-1483(+)
MAFGSSGAWYCIAHYNKGFRVKEKHPRAAVFGTKKMARPDKTIDNRFFYDPDLFPHLKLLKDNIDVIKEELAIVMKGRVVRADIANGSKLNGVWVNDDAMNDFYAENKSQEGWMHWWTTHDPKKANEDWTVFGLVHSGHTMVENSKLCPRTAKLLSQVNGIRVAGFSRLQPQSGIDTHKGFTGRRYGSLAWHLGLIVPSAGDVYLQCGPHTHYWQKEGEVIVFDDTFPHSAWNKSNTERVILYIDFKIPEKISKTLPSLLATDVTSSESDDNEDCEDFEEFLTIIKKG